MVVKDQKKEVQAESVFGGTAGGLIGKMEKGALEVAKYTLFNGEALAVTDFKAFPGASRENTPEQVAEEITRALAQIESGDFDILPDEPEG